MKYTVSLKGNRSFRRMYSKGKSAATPTVVLYCRRNGVSETAWASRWGPRWARPSGVTGSAAA